jgi:excisionase family DNA binding protein
MDALLLSIQDAARALSIGRTALYELINAGQIKPLHIGKRTLIPAEALTDFVAQLTASQSASTSAEAD